MNDLLITIRQHNEALSARGGHTHYRWHVVFTCRSQETQDALAHLDTRRNLTDDTLQIVSVEALTGEELDEVVSQLPKLKGLASTGHLKELLSRPKVLDILTLPDVVLLPVSVPTQLTETWLVDWFWKEVVRLGEQAQQARGHPERRESLLTRLTLQLLDTGGAVAPLSDVNAEALSGLVSDRLLQRSDNGLRFGHEVLEDWTLSVVLRQHTTDLDTFLLQIGEPPRASRAFQLFAVRCLEVQHDTGTWLELLRRLESNSDLSTRWYQLAVTALLYSPLLDEMLPRLRDELFENENHLFGRLLFVLRTSVVQPDPLVNTVFGDLAQPLLEKYLAYWTIPIWDRWIPVIRFAVENLAQLTGRGVLEFSYVARKWMESTTENQLLRREIALYAMKTLRSRFLVRRYGGERDPSPLNYDEEESVRRNLVNCVLQAADCLPQEVDDFVRQNALRSADRDRYDFEDEILGEGVGWAPLCKHLPDTALAILEAILCRKVVPDHFGSYNFAFMDLGISSFNGDMPPTPDKGPFRGFLQFHPEHGLDLIQRVVSHATRVWIMREEMERGKKPLPQILKLDSGDVEVWGDSTVYQWFTYPSLAPFTLTCALMALRESMDQRVKKGANPKELFENVLARTTSAAVVGVCTAVALANYDACTEAVVPIIENSAFWFMDIERYVHNLRQADQQMEIRNLILPVLLNVPPNVCERVRAAIRSFPAHPPLFYEDERVDTIVVQTRTDTCKVWAALAELQNYDLSSVEGQNQILIQFKLPKELEDQQQEKNQALEARGRLYAFGGWCIRFLSDGQQGTAFTIETAMAYALELGKFDDPNHRPQYSGENSETRADAIAMLAAALVLQAWDWIERNGHVAWCRDQLLVAASRPEPPVSPEDTVTRYEMGYRRSAARALPMLLSKNTKDSRVRKAIHLLAVHNNEEVREYLFGALRVLWGKDDTLVWRCIHDLEIQARKIGVRRKYWFLDEHPGVIVTPGRFATLKRLRARVDMLLRMYLIGLHAKPFRLYTHENLPSDVFLSSLHALPDDAAITRWANGSSCRFLADLVFYIVNNYLHFQKENSPYNEWSHYDRNRTFFRLLANAVLRLPEQQRAELLNPIIDKWEAVPSMMEELLHSLITACTASGLEQQLIEVWVPLGKRILASYAVVSPHWPIHRDLNEILGLLIFTDPMRITWQVDEWKPLRQVTGFIDLWVAQVGNRPDCFSNLVRLLKGIGFSIVPEFGIHWLYQCVSHADDPNSFFSRTRNTGVLAELLHASWSKQRLSIEQNQVRLKQFSLLVDRVAGQGEPLGLRLQAQLQLLKR